MKFLLDTHLMVWLLTSPERVSSAAFEWRAQEDSVLHFSTISIWEVVVKSALKRADFNVDAAQLNETLIEAGYMNVPVQSIHALTVRTLPPIHKDPFDRMLIAQAASEGLVLLTADAQLGGYPGPIRLV